MYSNMDSERKSWFRYITVEPTMFLYMFAFQLTSVVEQDLFVKKACLVNHNYTADICYNLSAYKDIDKEVKTTVSNFNQWNHIAANIFTIVIALFIGSWSDRRGRKFPLLIGLSGKLLYVLGLILNIYNEKWPVEYIIFTATVPSALTGVDIVIFASSFAYISDVSSVENRTLRITILDACYLVAFPIGIALGSYLFKAVDQSYIIMFSINSCIMMAAILYSAIRLKWRTSLRQESIREVRCNKLAGDFFDWQHLADTIKTLCKKRSNHCRAFLWIFLCAMFFYTFQRDENSYTYLYTTSKFHWKIDEYSNFKTFQSITNIIMVFLGVPIMTKLFKWKDTTIAMAGAYCFVIGRIFFALAEIPEIFYLGAALSSVGPVGGPLLRSMTSKVVPPSERGKVFSMLSVCDNAVPLVSSVLYTHVYNLSIGHFPYFFILTAVTKMILFFLMLAVHIMLRDQGLTMNEVSSETADNSAVNANVITNITNDSSNETPTFDKS